MRIVYQLLLATLAGMTIAILTAGFPSAQHASILGGLAILATVAGAILWAVFRKMDECLEAKRATVREFDLARLAYRLRKQHLWVSYVVALVANVVSIVIGALVKESDSIWLRTGGYGGVFLIVLTLIRLIREYTELDRCRDQLRRDATLEERKIAFRKSSGDDGSGKSPATSETVSHP